LFQPYAGKLHAAYAFVSDRLAAEAALSATAVRMSAFNAFS
jgi:hypothetical protein